MEGLRLVIDGEDTYREQPEVFYIHPCRIFSIRCVANNTFEGCTVQNSPVKDLSALNLVQVMEKMQPESTIEIIVDQPIVVMQDYDAKQIEANLKLAGFQDVTISKGEYEKEGKTIATKKLTGKKPEKAESAVLSVAGVATLSKPIGMANPNAKKKGKK